MDPLRTLLFVPANRERFLERARSIGADAILLDLEDGVPAAEKEGARQALVSWAGQFGRPTWVRVNDLASGLLERDLAAVVEARGVAGIVLPKVEERAMLLDVDAMLRRLEREGSDAPLEIIALIESARGVLATSEIVNGPRVASICVGSAQGGDLQADLGAAWSIDGPELMYARQHVLLAARAAGVAWPLDGVFSDVGDPLGFERDSALSRRLGYRGRTVIHPTQVEAANRIYSPSPAELEEARRILAALAAAEAEGHGTTTVDGRLVDVAMGRRARDVIALAEAIG